MVRAVKAREVDQNIARSMSAADANYLLISGYAVANMYYSLNISDSLFLRGSVNNIFNKEYQLRGFGGGIGNVSAGRDIRLAISYEL